MQKSLSLMVLVVSLMVLVVGFLGYASRPAAAEVESPRQLGDFLPGYSVARCLFAEGRLVLEHEGEFLVVRAGDAVPGRPRLRVLEIGGSEAVLGEARVGAAAGVAVPERLIKITEDSSGAVSVTLLSAEIPHGADTEVVIGPSSLFAPGEDDETAEPTGGGGGL